MNHERDEGGTDAASLAASSDAVAADPLRRNGFSANDGLVSDVRTGSPAWTAGLGINTKLVAVNSRTYSTDVVFDAVQSATSDQTPIELLVQHGDVYRTIAIPYYDGPRYPHLVRIDGTADRLSEVAKPKT